jgi:hypothetical protein
VDDCVCEESAIAGFSFFAGFRLGGSRSAGSAFSVVLAVSSSEGDLRI